VSALALAGEVALTDSVYQRTFSVADVFPGGGQQGKSARRPGGAGISFPEPPLRDMRLDVHVTSREPFRILTSAVQGSARPDLHLSGTGLLPFLRGPILFEDVDLALPSGILEFERGTVFLSESGPGRSTLDFVGRMQTQGLEITAQIGGTIDAPEVILSSVPPVFQEELVLFVLTGAPPGSASSSGGYVTAMATPMAVYLGKGVLDQILGGSPSKGSDIAGRLEVQIGRETTDSGSPTVDARLRLKKNFIAKGGTLYLTSEKDVYDQENLGLKIIFKYK
jgi:translocation and assembly module TamB